MERGKNERGAMEMVDTESLVPPGHLFRQVDAAVDFEKLYEIVEPLNSEEEGRRSIGPVVLFKIVLLQHLDGNASLRGTLRRAQTAIAYRWFLRYTLSEELPHFSAVSYSLRHRYTPELKRWWRTLPTRPRISAKRYSGMAGYCLLPTSGP